MKQHILNWLSFSIILLLLSCKKDPIARWDKGKYDMTHIINLSDGQSDTIHCVVYGPLEEKGQYTFNPGVENDGAGELIIYKGTKKKKGYFKVKYFVSIPILYPTYYGASVESYTSSKRDIAIHYKNDSNDDGGIVSGEITLNWID